MNLCFMCIVLSFASCGTRDVIETYTVLNENIPDLMITKYAILDNDFEQWLYEKLNDIEHFVDSDMFYELYECWHERMKTT